MFAFLINSFISIPPDSLSIFIGAGSLALMATLVGYVLCRRHWPFRPRSSTNYLIRYLTDEQVEALRAANVPFSANGTKAEDRSIPLYHLLVPDPQSGVIVAGKHLRSALAQLRATVAYSVRGSTEKSEELILRFNAAADEDLSGFQVHVGDLYDFNRETVSSVVREVILPVVKKDIVVHAGGYAQNPASDGRFHIYFWASPPESKGQIDAPDKLAGVPVAPGTSSFKPSGRGLPIYDEQGSFVIAELVDENNLYIHPDILQQALESRRSQSFFGNGGFSRYIRTLLVNRKRNQDLGLLVRLLQRVSEELQVPAKLRRICAELNKSLPRPLVKRKATSQGLSGRRRDLIEILCEELLTPVVGADVVVWHKGGKAAQPVGDSRFHVMLHSGPTGTPLATAPSRLWGAALSINGTSFYPSTLGLPLTDNEGNLVGELLNRNLYIGHELMKFGSREDAATLIRVLLHVRRELERFQTLTEAELEESVAAQFAAEYVRQCPPSTREAALTDKKLASSLAQARREYAACLAATLVSQNDWFRLSTGPDAELANEFDAVLSIPKVRGVEFHKDAWLLVKTDMIFCTDPRTGSKHEIGEFDIYIPIEGPSIYWKNRTRHIKTPNGVMNAPHVNNEGLACLGNAKDEVHMLLRGRHYAAAIELAIAFVEAVNVNDSWGKYINKWPLAAPDTAGGGTQ